MLNLGILEAETDVQKHLNAITSTMSKMNGELATINRNDLKPEVVSRMETQIREKYTPTVRDSVKAISEIGTAQMTVAKFWESKEFVASQIPITKPLADNVPFRPADPNAEIMARQGLSQEYARMPNDLLALHFEAAKASGKIGLAYLITSVNQQREKPAPFDLGSITIPTQEKALEVLRTTRSARSTAEIYWAETLGSRPSPVAKINAAREAMGPVTPPTDAEIAQQRAQREGRAA